MQDRRCVFLGVVHPWKCVVRRTRSALESINERTRDLQMPPMRPKLFWSRGLCRISPLGASRCVGRGEMAAPAGSAAGLRRFATVPVEQLKTSEGRRSALLSQLLQTELNAVQQAGCAPADLAQGRDQAREGACDAAEGWITGPPRRVGPRRTAPATRDAATPDRR